MSKRPHSPPRSTATAMADAAGMASSEKERSWMLSDFDGCACGDYRHQHANGTGRCNLGSLCTPYPCLRFRLFSVATKIPPPYLQSKRRENPCKLSSTS